jgi:hypothetical protein
MNTTDNSRLPDPLPVRVRPNAGESVESYIRRLAQANHLRPSLLQVFVRDPSQPSAGIRPERLAAVMGSTPTALAHALTNLPQPRRPRTPQHRPSATPQAARKAQLFKAIRADDVHGLSIRHIAQRHKIHRRMVRQALSSPTPQPPPRKKINRPAPVLDPIRDVIDSLLDKNMTVWQIWVQVVDQYDADASYATVRRHIRDRNTGQIR